MTDADAPKPAYDELADIAETSRKTHSILASALIMTFLFGVSGAVGLAGLEDFAVGSEDYENTRLGGVIFLGLATVSLAVALVSLAKVTWTTFILWPVIGFWWLSWVLTLVSGQFPGIPWIAAIATYTAFVGSRAVFRYRWLMREERKRETAAPA